MAVACLLRLLRLPRLFCVCGGCGMDRKVSVRKVGGPRLKRLESIRLGTAATGRARKHFARQPMVSACGNLSTTLAGDADSDFCRCSQPLGETHTINT